MSATLINLPPPSYSEPDSGPGTPMSGISTIAIKDGHEGSRPSTDGVSGADRIQRLGLGMGYFDQAPLPRSASATSTPNQSTAEHRSSPASSTVTTSSTLEATKEAKLIDGMTYDEGVVDTTDKTPAPVSVGNLKEDAARRRREMEQHDPDQVMEGMEQNR